MSISAAEAKLDLVILNSKAQILDRIDVVTRFTNADVPLEVICRLDELWESTKVIAGQIIHVGKIIILEILRFIHENPNLVVGVAVGAAAGALIGCVPFLGPLLAPLAAAIGAVIGGLAGSRLDRGQESGDGVLRIAQDVIVLARKFFELIVSIFNALKVEFEAENLGDPR